MRKYYGEDGTLTHHQILIPKHIVPEFLSTLHGKTSKHPGITKMIQESRTKYYYPGLARNSQQTDCHETNTPKNAEQHGIYIRPRGLLRSRHSTKLTFIQWIQAHHNNDGRFLPIPLRIPYAVHDSQNSRPMHN